MFDEGQSLPHHYHRTKYESERLVREGVEADTVVFRPGIVVGHSETGEMDKIDGPYYFFKLIQRLRQRCRSGSRSPALRADRPTSCRWTSWRGRWTTSPTCPTTICRAARSISSIRSP